MMMLRQVRLKELVVALENESPQFLCLGKSLGHRKKGVHVNTAVETVWLC